MDDIVSIYNPVGVGAINAFKMGVNKLKESDSPAGFLARGDFKGLKEDLTTPKYSLPTEEDMFNLGLDTMTPMGVIGSIGKKVGKKLTDKFGKEYVESVYRPGEFLESTPTKPNKLVGNRYNESTVETTKNPRIITDLNELIGSMILPKASDVTSRGKVIDEISGQTMKNKPMTEGGIYYGTAPQNLKDDIFYASNKSAAVNDVSRLENASQEGLRLGGTGKVIYAPSKMARYSEDFSTMPTEYALNFIDNGRISKQLISELDDEIRATLPKWKGIMTEGGRKQLFNPSDIEADKVGSVYRKKLTARLRNQKYQKELGFNWADLEGALLEDAVKKAPTNSLGRVMYDVDVNKLALKPSRHKSYTDDLVAPNEAVSLGFDIPITKLYGDKYMNDLLTGKINYQDWMTPKKQQQLKAKGKGVKYLLDNPNPLQDAYGVMYMGKSGKLGKFMDEQSVDELYNYQQFLNKKGLIGE